MPVVLPRLRSARDACGRVDGGALIVHGLATSARLDERSAIVVGRTTARPTSWRPSALILTTITGIDPRLGLVACRWFDARPWRRAPQTGRAAVAAGQRALAHELVGRVADHARAGPRARARPHPVRPSDRRRSRPCATAWPRPSSPSRLPTRQSTRRGTTAPPSPPALAKAIAGRSARTVARHGQQVLAGIGFTTEHPFHHYVRRVLVLDQLFGDTRSLTSALGEQLLQDRRLPMLLPL